MRLTGGAFELEPMASGGTRLVMRTHYQPLMMPVKHSEILQESMPNATLHIVENAGHLAMAEQPDIVADLLKKFVDSIPIRTRKTKKDRVELNVEVAPSQEAESTLQADSASSQSLVRK